ncbi:type II toxin-antitoxin system RelB/DinJ family antitoxin [Pasteurella testudinis]|uniref:type II toxin-antitoxin system RelB/DinJ family antitoxin n=1 Tax=Pasteurella testudinis TaxID=761 RepID=UPI0040581EE4
MSSTNNASFSFRVAETLKMEAFGVISEYGFTPSQVFNLFLTEIAKTKTVPVNLSYLKPNSATLRAMKEAENGELETIDPSKNNSINEALLKIASKN